MSRTGNRAFRTLAAIAIVLGGGLALWKFVIAVDVPPPTAPPRDLGPTPVEVSSVAPRELVLLVEAYGNLEPRRRVSITSETNGRIVAVLERWRPGEPVQPDELLVALDRRPAELELEAAVARREEADAAVGSAQVELQGARQAQEKAVEQREIAQREYERQVELGGFASDSLRDRAQNALVLAELNEETTRITYEGAKAALAGAQARASLAAVAVEQAKDVLARTEIRAPFAGRLRGQPPGVGTLATPGQVLGELLALDTLVLTAKVPERDLVVLRRGMEAELSFPSSPGLADLLTVRGVVTGIDAAADPLTRRGDVEIEIHGTPADGEPGVRHGEDANGWGAGGLAAGLFARAAIEVRRIPDALWIDRRHVWWADGQPRAYVAVAGDGGDVAEARELVLVREHGEGFLLGSGLAAGDRLITHPLDRVTPGGAVVAGGGDPDGVRSP